MTCRGEVVFAIAIVGVAGAAIVLDACRTVKEEPPAVSLATSPDAEATFRVYRARWLTGTKDDRAKLREPLAEFHDWLEKRSDGLEPMVRAYLAIAWLDADVPEAASALARPLYEGPPGVSHDLGVLVKGAAERRAGKSEEALQTLQPIVGKLIDEFARPLLYEEMTEALLDQGRYADAIIFAEGWMRAESTTDRKLLHDAVARVLRRVPVDVAERTLAIARDPDAGYSREMLVILAERVRAPLDEDDGGALDGAVAYSSSDAEIYVPEPAPIRFDGRTIALLAPSTAMGYDGVATALGRAATIAVSPSTAAGSKADAGADVSIAPPAYGSAHVAVFDTGGTKDGVDHAFHDAQIDGAAIVIGGATDVEANELAALAQAKSVPAILLRAPSNAPSVGAKRWYFVVGPSIVEEEKAARDMVSWPGELAYLDRAPEGIKVGSTTVAPPPIDDPLRARCDATPKTATSTAFPVGAWAARKVSSILVLGDASCAKRLVADLATTPNYKPRLVLGVESEELVHATLPYGRSALASGLLPVDDGAPASLRALWHAQKSPVGWWNALGHDAAVLAVAALPVDPASTIEPSEIVKAREKTVAALASAHPPAGESLWSTGDLGFTNGVLPRTFSTRMVGADGGWRPAWLAPADLTF